MIFLSYILIYFSTICLTNSVSIVNRRRVYNLTATYAANSSSVVLINNQIPGPLIEADLNDIVIVHVRNMLTANEGLTIHFHGMHFRQSPQMDGVPALTQMPIEQSHTFTYVFRAYPSGTYFYHSHAGLQSITAFGPLVVHDRRRPWNASEVSSGPLLFSDYWVQPDRHTQEVGLLSSPYRWQGEPTYLLINGKRDFVLNVEPDTKYFLRLIGATTLSTVVFGIDEHPMTVVEVDGTLIEPKDSVTSIELSSGQRYGVIIQTKKQVDRVFLMQLSIRWREIVNGSNCTGVLRYSTISEVPTDLSFYPSPILATEVELRSFSFSNPYRTLLTSEQMPRRAADKEFYILNYQDKTSDGGTRWYTNNASLDEHYFENITEPLLFSMYHGDEESIPQAVTYTLGQNQIIDFVLQNTVLPSGVCDTHPFHVHGHKFWIHSQGSGLYNAGEHQTPDSDNPIYCDTVTLYATSYEHSPEEPDPANHLKPCGWIKVRLISDNPGLWLFHCHIGSHMMMGMTVILKEDNEHIVMNSMSQH